MKNVLSLILHIMIRVLPFIIIITSLLSCERPQDDTRKNDLFPLKVGNEYYYSYRYSKWEVTVDPYCHLGNKQWRIISATSDKDTIEYVFEEITHYRMDILLEHEKDTAYNWKEPDTVNFTLFEHPTSGVISFKPPIYSRYFPLSDNISLQRYSDKVRVIVDYYEDNDPESNYEYLHSYSWTFASDSGLVAGNEYFMQDYWGIFGINYTFNLDSLKIIQ